MCSCFMGVDLDVTATPQHIDNYSGYLTDQFLTRAWNKRTDKYGGDLKGRMTFLFEMMDAVRAKCGPDFPIILKITIDHCYPENPEYRTLEEGLEMCRLLKEHGGFDALHLDRGCYEKYWFQIPTTYEEKGINLDAYKQVKAIMGDIPILGHGKLNDPAVAEKAIEDGCLDIVLLGKQLLYTARQKDGVLTLDVPAEVATFRTTIEDMQTLQANGVKTLVLVTEKNTTTLNLSLLCEGQKSGTRAD